MPHKKPFQPDPVSRLRPRPGQDIIIRKQAARFPEVGMTLSSYKQTPFTGAASAAPPFSGTAVAGRTQPGRWKRFLRAITLKRTVVTLAILVLLIGGWVGGKFIYNTHKIFGGSIFGVLSTTKLKGEDSGRVNILLAGNSADDPGHNGASLTDSILIMSIDTKNNTAFLLSVPRDLWVEIPGEGHEKINDAYVVGEANDFDEDGYPDGGMGQLEEIIEQDFGLPIDYYALIDYDALKDAVNAVGGISVTIKSTDPRGLYDPSIDYATHGPLVKLTNGTHVLNGEQALDLARARGDAYGSYGFPQSDFDRTQNQRMMLVALKNKAVSANVLSNPAKLSNLSDALGNNVKTDFTLSEVHRLYDLMKPINSNNIASLSLNSANGKNLLANYTAPDGEAALIPAAGVDDYDDIQAYVTQQTSSNPVVREGATIVVLNATNATGLASKERIALTAKNLDVTAVGDASADQATTTIIDNSSGKKPATRKLLLQLFGDHFTTVNSYEGAYQADFIVLLGADRVSTTSATTTSSD